MTTSAALLPMEAAERNCYLTTTGRVTGNQHEIEIWFAVDPDDATVLYLLSGGRDRADWVKNIRREPAVHVRVGQSIYSGHAAILEPDDPRDSRAREIVAGKYQDWRAGQDFSQWARTSLPVVIHLAGTSSTPEGTD